ncbi:MAG: hypothetical protein E7470_05945 [Ruminococcaceae bacterium]|nr:hypothetical protein [Oscillospiraceae bacterium]
MKRIVCVFLALMLCVSAFAVTAFAASAGGTLTGPGTVRAGDTITLTFNLNGSGIFGVSGVLSYDASQLELKSTSQKIGNGWAVEFNGNNFAVYDNNLANPINKNTALFTVIFKVKASVATGAAVKVSCNEVTASDGSADINVGTVTYSATIAPPMSSDNTLKSLTVSNATISPAFSAGTTSYTAEVPFEVSKLDVKAAANDSKAKVSIDSPNLTPNGTTNVTVTVTAENGSKKTYTIAVKRAQDPNYVASSNNDLAGISVDGFLLSPVFSANQTEYVIWLPYETERVQVSGVAADSKGSVRVEGGDNLIAGADNEIKVICIAEDGTEKVYTVIAKRAPAHDGSTEPTEPPTEATEPTDPSKEPTSEPATEPSVAPTEPQQPDEQGSGNGGIQTWVVLAVGIACLAAGIGAGVLIGRKSGKK